MNVRLNAVIPAEAGIQNWTPAFAGVTAMMIVCLMSLSVYAAALAENQARFAEVSGEVDILASGSSQWVEAHIDLPIEPGDQIQVGEGGAELSMAESVVLYLDSHTHVVAGRATPKEGRMQLRSGALLGKMEPAKAPVGNWSFETPLGICGVRGTEFALLHSDDDGTRLGVFKGEVQLSPAETAEGTSQPVLIRAKEEGVLQKQKPLKVLNAYSPHMRSHFGPALRLQKRFPQIGGIWVPLTVDYRQELRKKFIAPPEKVRKRRGPGRRIQSP